MSPPAHEQEVELDRPQYFRLPGKPDREYFALCPANVVPGTPALVVVHGISRNAIEQLLRFAPLARQYGVPLIAPLFERKPYRSYQQLVDPKKGIRADLALLDIIEDAARRWPINAQRFQLFGFSGGSQFAHRFTFAHPQRVIACVGTAAGWYTWPDQQLPYPQGLGSNPLADAAFDLDAIRRVPIHIVVGTRDTARDAALRKDEQIDALQGRNRVERARRWHQAMRDAGMHPAGSLTELARTRHNFDRAFQRGLGRIVFEKLGHAPGEIEEI